MPFYSLRHLILVCCALLSVDARAQAICSAAGHRVETTGAEAFIGAEATSTSTGRSISIATGSHTGSTIPSTAAASNTATQMCSRDLATPVAVPARRSGLTEHALAR
jgi:hypothetical protein